MSRAFQTLLRRYEYAFPKDLIATRPAHPRDSARLLIYDRKTKKTVFDSFRNIGAYVPPKSLLVLNETRVLPARFFVERSTGGRVEILYTGIESKRKVFRALANKALHTGEVLQSSGGAYFYVVGKKEREYFLRSSFPVSRMTQFLEKHGTTPLPPYMKGSDMSERVLREEYQTVFAHKKGSIAAPTASLHFTKSLLKALEKSGHEIVYITLHVNLGTFASLTSEQVRRGKLHREYVEISAGAARKINDAKRSGKSVVAVGTTVVRALESASNKKGIVSARRAVTDIFITPTYTLKVVDGLITNFHVPRSSLLMLVSAFVPRKQLLEIYQKAIRKKFRLFSFGDAMFIR